MSDSIFKEDLKLFIIQNIENRKFFIVTNIFRHNITGFSNLLNIKKKTLLKAMENFNCNYIYYTNRPDLMEFFFQTEEDAENAKEWIESRLVFKKLCE